MSVTGKARRETEEAELLAPPPKTKEVALPQGRRARGVCYLGLRRPPAGSGWGPPKVGGHELTQQQPRSNASAPPSLRIPSLQTRAKFHGRAWKLRDVPPRGGGPRGDGAAWRRERPAGEGGREAGVRAGGDFPARLGHRPPNLVKDRWKPLICLSSVLTSGKWLFGVSFTSNKTLLTFAPGKEVPVKLRALTIRNHRPARRSCLLVARWRLLFPPEAQTAAPEEPLCARGAGT